MKNLIKVSLVITAIGVAMKVGKEIKELKFKTSSNTGKLSTRPGLSEIDRLDLRIDRLLEKINQ